MESTSTAAEANYRIEEVMRAFRQIFGGSYDMNAGHITYDFPGYASDLVPDRLRAAAELPIIIDIMKMAGKLKGFSPPHLVTATTSAAATSAETNYCIEDAMRVLGRITGRDTDSVALEFQSIVEKLPIDDLQTLKKLLEEPYFMMLRYEMGVDYPYPEVKAASGGGDSFPTKFALAIGVMLAKVVGGAVLGAFDPTTTVEPFKLEKAAGAMGLMSAIGGMVVQDKKPGLSRAMLKFGCVTIALSMIVPMAVNLDNLIMSWIFGVLAVAIVAVTVTFA